MRPQSKAFSLFMLVFSIVFGILDVAVFKRDPVTLVCGGFMLGMSLYWLRDLARNW